MISWYLKLPLEYVYHINRRNQAILGQIYVFPTIVGYDTHYANKANIGLEDLDLELWG